MEKGRELMESGMFGAFDNREPLANRKRLARRLLDRELGLGDHVGRKLNQDLMVQVRIRGQLMCTLAIGMSTDSCSK